MRGKRPSGDKATSRRLPLPMACVPRRAHPASMAGRRVTSPRSRTYPRTHAKSTPQPASECSPGCAGWPRRAFVPVVVASFREIACSVGVRYCSWAVRRGEPRKPWLKPARMGFCGLLCRRPAGVPVRWLGRDAKFCQPVQVRRLTLRAAAKPTRPRPSSVMLAGSGTGFWVNRNA